MNSGAVKKMIEVAEELRRRSDELVEAAEALRNDLDLGWHLPVGTEAYPPERWYAATVHDLTGRCVRTLARGSYPAHRYAVTWDGRDEDGRAAPAGVYFLKLNAERTRKSQRLVLLR